MPNRSLFVVVLFALSLASAPAAPRPVSLADCIQMALEGNLDIQIQRFDSQFRANDLTIAYAGYEPTFTLSGQRSFSDTGGTTFNPNTGFASFGSETTSDSFNSAIAGVLPYTGMEYRLRGDVRESESISSGTNSITSQLGRGSVAVELSQPLLRGLLIDQTRFNIATAKNRLKFSEAQLRQQIINSVTAVELAYYDLAFARESLKVQEKGLELAERLLSDNRKRVEVGALAPLDEKQAESQVAARKADLLSAQRQLGTAQNSLKRLITDAYAALRDTTLDPSENLVALPPEIDLQESWRRGLAFRPDLQQVRLNIDQDLLDQRYYRNQMLPQLDVFGSYGHAASGPSQTYGDAFGDFRTGDFPFWSVGAEFSIPLGNTVPRTRYRSTTLTLEQSRLILKRLEQDVLVQIDDAARLAKTNFERIDATRQARQYAEAALAAEEKKLENGKSTSFIVLQLQRDLTNARSDEIRALTDYNKSLSSLAQSEGTTLQRHKIDLTVR
jgi:outer membrane protein TolC